MISVTELNLMRDVPPLATENVAAILRAATRPLDFSEIQEAGGGGKDRLRKTLDLMLHRRELKVTTAGSVQTMIVKFYGLPEDDPDRHPPAPA